MRQREIVDFNTQQFEIKNITGLCLVDEKISNKVKVGVEHQPDHPMLCIR